MEENENNQEKMENILARGQEVYYARIQPTVGIYDVLDLKVHNINSKMCYFTACNPRNQQTHLFNDIEINTNVFLNRADALKKVLAAEDKYQDLKVSNETAYEEY